MFALEQIALVKDTIETLDDTFTPDPMGYFVIHATKKGLRAEHYTPDDMPTTVLTTGANVPLDCQAEALRKRILSTWPQIRPEHYGYICQELGRAQMAMQWEVPYTQG